jgi:hypothetical protein
MRLVAHAAELGLCRSRRKCDHRKGVLMAADDVPRRPHLPPHQPPQRRRIGRPATKIVLVAGLAAYSWFAAGTVPFTWKALLIVLVPGAVVGAIAYGRPPKRIPPPDSLDATGFSYWAIAVAALFEWEASGFRAGSPWWHPSLTGLIDPALGARPVKAAGIMLWLLAGWALVRR